LDSNALFTIGLIINELLTNSEKYAFPGDRRGQISIELLQKEPGILALQYADNGVGISENSLHGTSDGFGLKLVHLLTDQLKGTISLEREKGTRYAITFPIQHTMKKS
jgi:two-component sensor histidine kinase